MPKSTFALEPPPGLNSDDTAFAASGRWADGNNVRFVNGRAQAIWSFAKHSDFASQLTGVPRNIYGSGVLIGTSEKLYSGTTDISPVGFGGTSAWAFAPWGDVIILAVPTGGTLYETGSGTATEIANAPDQITWMLVTPERQVLAFGCNEEGSGAFNGKCIRGSDLEDNTDWTTSATNNAFEHILDSPTVIVTARMVGQYVGVWTEDGLYLGQFIGDPSQTYRFDRIGANCGACGPNAVTVANGVAYWVGPDSNMWAWTPGSLPTMVPCPISVEFQTNYDAFNANKVIVGHNSRFDEIWVFYPDLRENTGENTRYIAYAVRESALMGRPVWFRGQLARSAYVDGPLVQLGLLSSPHADATVMAGDASGWIYIQERNPDFDDGLTAETLTWHIQSADQYLDNGERRAMINRFTPDFDVQKGSITLTVYAKDRPQSSPVTEGPFTIAEGDTKKDFRASGKLIAVKLSAASATTRMRLGKPTFDVVTGGLR